MSNSTKRDNYYWLGRLEKDGRNDLIDKVKGGDMTVYQATIEAGFRKKRSTSSRADQISYHYSRATLAEKRRFIIDNWTGLTRIMSNLAKLQRASVKAQISDGQEQK